MVYFVDTKFNFGHYYNLKGLIVWYLRRNEKIDEF